MISGVLLDIAGVLYIGDVPVPGAIEAVERLRQSGLPVRFVSNTTRSSKASVVTRLGRLGFPVADHELFTPAQAALTWLEDHKRSPHLLVHPDLEPDFAGIERRKGKAVIVGDAGETFNYRRLNRAFRALMEGAEFVALAPNRAFRDADEKLSLDAGPFVAALEFGSQRKATVLGKPSKAFFEAALTSMNCPSAEAVMVGDDAEADIAGALKAGLGHALLVRTGKYRQGDEKRFRPRPTAVAEDIGAAVDWIAGKKS